MKHGLKVLWIGIAVVFAVGLVISGIALAAGAQRPFSFSIDQRGLHINDDTATPVELSEHNLAELHDIRLALTSADLRFVVGDNYGYEIQTAIPDRFAVSAHDGKLDITEHIRWGLGFGGWGLDFQFPHLFGDGWDNQSVTVYLPRGCVLDTLHIQVVSGTTEIVVDDLAISDFNYDAVSGSLQARSPGLKANALNLKTISGDVQYRGLAGSAINIDMVSGHASLELDGSADNYQFSVDKVSGEVLINGHTVDDDADIPIGRWRLGDEAATGRISIHLISGQVDMRFAER
ncbi:MAG: DUF4097 domain-containing protein [Coriobacteriales bacterium]|jgi:hypothetical protein|nr:DUF4097 domain-containing protein [Coriobacteriales bacterium]